MFDLNGEAITETGNKRGTGLGGRRKMSLVWDTLR